MHWEGILTFVWHIPAAVVLGHETKVRHAGMVASIHFSNGHLLSLRIDQPTPNCCLFTWNLKLSFSTSSVFKVIIWKYLLFICYHQDLHRAGHVSFTPLSRPKKMRYHTIPCSYFGLGEGFDGRLVLQDVPLRRRKDVQDLVLDLLEGALVFRPRQDELVLLLLQIRALVLHHDAEQLA